MTNRYKQIMDKINVTAEMRSRILSNIQSAGPGSSSKVVRFPSGIRYLSIAACFVVLLVGAVTLSRLLDQPVQTPPPDQVIPDLVECSSAGELSQAVGFAVADISGLPFQPEASAYTAYWHELAQITYTAGDQEAVFRKSIGEEDNSGDYNVYDSITEVAVQSVTVTLKGSSEGYLLALWQEEDFSCSLRLSQGMSESEWVSLLSQNR